MSTEIYENMIQSRGSAYRSDQIKAWSHYREPVDNSAGRLAGNSRIWGDASPEVQSRVIDALIESSKEAGLTPRETAHVLAIARQESGFNPDAAAGTTSASGLGQFIDRTGQAYGLGNQNRFDINAQSDALVAHFIDNRKLAISRGQGEEYIYKYHHDGPTKDYGGLGLSKSKIMPLVDRYEQFVNERLGLQAQIGNKPDQRLGTVVASQENDIKAVQTTLATLGYLGQDGKPLAQDGIRGPNTEHAVRAFQQAHGLSADGIVGPQTLKALEQAKANPLVSEARHPNHALYTAIAEQLPPGTDPKVAANIALHAQENGITSPDKLRAVHVNGHDVFVLSTSPDPAQRARVDMQAPTPDMQSMSDHMAQQSAQQQQAEQQRNQQMNMGR